jgi:anthranilate synthase component 1
MTKLHVGTKDFGRDFEAVPAAGVFAKHYAAGRPQVVWTRLVADLETPVSAMLKLSDGRPMSCLLESVEGGAVRGRYSIIGINPDIVWRAFGDKARSPPAAEPRTPRAREAADPRRCARSGSSASTPPVGTPFSAAM